MFIFSKTYQMFVSSNKKIRYLPFFFNKYFATKCYLSKMALAVSFRLIYETIPFRKLLFSIALIVNC